MLRNCSCRAGRKARDEAREARNEVYRQHILEAAERVFAERGFEVAKVQDIARGSPTSRWGRSTPSSPARRSCSRAHPRQRVAQELAAPGRARWPPVDAVRARRSTRPDRDVYIDYFVEHPDVPAHAPPLRRLVGARPVVGRPGADAALAGHPRAAGRHLPPRCRGRRVRRSRTPATSPSSSAPSTRSCWPNGSRAACATTGTSSCAGSATWSSGPSVYGCRPSGIAARPAKREAALRLPWHARVRGTCCLRAQHARTETSGFPAVPQPY